MPRPNFFIVGCPKCGTSSMHEYLAQHPSVFMSRLKEPNYFCHDLKIRSEAPTESDYLALFDLADSASRIGESSTWYMFSPKAASLINQFDPAAKVVMILRQPVDAAYSLHGQMLWSCNEDILDFEQALAAQEDRRAGRRIPADATSPDGLQYESVFTYTPQVQRYLDALGRDRCKVILFEEFTRDTARVFRETLEFLGLDPFQPSFEIVNSAKPVSPGFNRFFARRPRLRAAIHTLVPQTLQWKLSHLLPYFTRTVKRAPKITPDLRKTLLPRFRKDIESLAELIGRDLRHWCKE